MLKELATNWVGKKVDVVIEQVEPENNKIIGSIRTAVRYRHSRNMAVSHAPHKMVMGDCLSLQAAACPGSSRGLSALTACGPG